MKRILLIHPDGKAAGCLNIARLVPALEAAGAIVQVHEAISTDGLLLDALSTGALPVVIRAVRRNENEAAGTA